MVISTTVNAQFFDKSAISVGYQYLGKSVFQIGFDQRLSDDSKTSFKIGVDALIGKFENNKKLYLNYT